jgi:hypothetical protein
VSQTLTLFTIPVSYLYLERLSGWLGRRRPDRAGLQGDHALVPANRYPLPAVIYRDAAE